MVKRSTEKPVEFFERGTQRLPDWKFDMTTSSDAAAPAFASAMRSSRDERLTLEQRRRALAGSLGLTQAEVGRLGLPDTLARLDDALGSVEQVIGTLNITLPPETLEQLVEQVTRRVVERLQAAQAAPLPDRLTVKQAADRMQAKPQRVHDLLSQRKLSRYKEGGRTMVSREEVDARIKLESRALPQKK